jgi:hypothetical protein
MALAILSQIHRRRGEERILDNIDLGVACLFSLCLLFHSAHAFCPVSIL